MKSYRNDILLIGLLLLIGLGFLCFHHFSGEVGGNVKITVDGELYGNFPLSQTKSIELKGDNWKNVVLIEDDSVIMEEADCPDHICLDHAPISKVNETIVCLPHKVVVEVTQTVDGDTTEEEIDVFSR